MAQNKEQNAISVAKYEAKNKAAGLVKGYRLPVQPSIYKIDGRYVDLPKVVDVTEPEYYSQGEGSFGYFYATNSVTVNFTDDSYDKFLAAWIKVKGGLINE